LVALMAAAMLLAVRVVPLAPQLTTGAIGPAGWPAAPAAGLCAGVGVALLILAAVDARQHHVSGTLAYEEFQTGVVAGLKDGYVRGEMTLADYTAGVTRVLQPAEAVATARVPFRLTLAVERRRQTVCGAGGALLLTSGLLLGWPAMAASPTVPLAPHLAPAAALQATGLNECLVLPPGLQRKCELGQRLPKPAKAAFHRPPRPRV
jgi:hypothetical protein